MAIVTSSLIRYWHYGQGISGNTWPNIAPTTTGQGNGTLVGAALVADGVNFDRVDDKATFPNPTLNAANQEITIEMGFSPLEELYFQSIIGISGTNRMRLASFGDLQSSSFLGYSIPSITGFYTVGTWNRLCIKMKNGEQKIFVNGVLKSTLTTAKAPVLNAIFAIGSDNESNYFGGKIAYLRIYNRYLSDAEILQNDAEGTNIGLEEEPPPTGNAYTKSLSDSIAFSESLSKIISRKKILAESLATSESLIKLSSRYKSLSDSVTSNDIISKQLSVAVIDTVSTGDAENDKTAKALSDTLSGTDALSKSLIKAIQDGIDTGDQILQSGGNSANLSDSIAITDNIRKALIKYQSDNVTTSESDSERVTKQILDSLAQSDTITSTKGKAVILSDGLFVADSLRKAVSRLQSDSVGIVDSFTKQSAVSVRLYDVVISTDDLRTYLPNVPEYSEVIRFVLNISQKQTFNVAIIQRDQFALDITQRKEIELEI